MNLKSLFGVNGVRAGKTEFQKWATKELASLFPFSKNLVSDTEIVYNHIDEFDKFKDSRVLIIGGGPSSNEVNWENLDYDYVFSINHFYKNEKLKNRPVDLISVGAEVDLQSDEFVSYVSEHNPTLVFEWHGRWYNESEYFRQLSQVYPKVSCLQTRAYGKLGGGIRLMILAMYLGVKEIYIVGLDGCPGLSVKTKEFTIPKHSFESGKVSLPWKITPDNAYEIYHHQYDTLWKYVTEELKFDTTIFNLGEDCDFNFSSIWTKEISPLPTEIKQKINKN